MASFDTVGDIPDYWLVDGNYTGTVELSVAGFWPDRFGRHAPPQGQGLEQFRNTRRLF